MTIVVCLLNRCLRNNQAGSQIPPDNVSFVKVEILGIRCRMRSQSVQVSVQVFKGEMVTVPKPRRDLQWELGTVVGL
jgi:hypothetical protein